MRNQSLRSQEMLAIGLVFRRLFDLPSAAIQTSPPHQIRCWLDRILMELRRERNRGKARHYRYDLNRHIALAHTRDFLLQQLK